MQSGVVSFPTVHAAMEVRKAAFETCRNLGAKPPFSVNPAEREVRVEWQQRHDEADAAIEGVMAAYAGEMLPAILGGEWIRSRVSLHARGRSRGSYVYIAGEVGLFDHPIHFRSRHSKGRLTWDNCVIIGQPYLSLRGPDGERDKLSVGMATELRETFGVGVWARDDLSAWYPGWTVLVLAARGLKPEKAADFGFTAL
jgi:hypothetical protein